MALEKDIEKAISEGNFDRAQSLSGEISKLHMDQALCEAAQKSSYEQELAVIYIIFKFILRHNVKSRSQFFPGSISIMCMLMFRFARKERWERKANN